MFRQRFVSNRSQPSATALRSGASRALTPMHPAGAISRTHAATMRLNRVAQRSPMPGFRVVPPRGSPVRAYHEPSLWSRSRPSTDRSYTITPPGRAAPANRPLLAIRRRTEVGADYQPVTFLKSRASARPSQASPTYNKAATDALDARGKNGGNGAFSGTVQITRFAGINSLSFAFRGAKDNEPCGPGRQRPATVTSC